MNGKIFTLQISVSGGDVGVACLIPRDDDARSGCKVTNTGVLQAVKLIFVSPVQRLPDRQPPLPELLTVCLPFAGLHPCTEEITIAGMTEDVKVKHKPDD